MWGHSVFCMPLCDFKIDLPDMAEHSTILKLLNWITNSKNTKNKVFEAIFVFICIFQWRKLKLKWQRVPGFTIVFSLCFACFRGGLLWLFPYLWLYLSYSLDFISRIINYLHVSFCFDEQAINSLWRAINLGFYYISFIILNSINCTIE